MTLLQRGNRLVKLTPAGQSSLTEARLILKLTESAALLARRGQGWLGQYRLHRRVFLQLCP
ncbi:MAG: LysR family transcriptional regulator [Bradyrhizobium sp.]|nr:LysR family transcriptional regulator [Bradyrhizobium sp.]